MLHSIHIHHTLVTWCEELTHWKRLWCWERLKAGGEGDNRGWDVGWHHRLDGHEFEQALGVDYGQRSLVCCCPQGLKDLDTTEWLNWTEHILINKIVTNGKKKKKRRRCWQGLRKSSNQRIVTQKKSHITSLISEPSLNTLPCIWSWNQEVEIWD